MDRFGDDGFGETIDPPSSASGFHRQETQNTQNAQTNITTRSKPESEQVLSSQQQKQSSIEQEKQTGCTKFCKLDYYKQYFNITEGQVKSRLMVSLTLPHRQDFLGRTKSNPDFYGPFWVLTTLVVLLGTVGNLANYLLSKFSSGQVWQDYFFKLEFIRYGFCVVYSFGIVVPGLCFLYLKFFGGNNLFNLPELICLYGYAMVSYLFAMVACIIPVGFIQWLLLLAAAGNSVMFLYANLRSLVPGSPYVVMGVIAGVQVGLSVILKILFLELLEDQ